MENLRNLDQFKRGKPPEVSNPITEEDSEFLSNFGLLVPNSYQDLSNDCAEQVQFKRQFKWEWKWKTLEKRRLPEILQKNSTLLFKFMILFKHKCELNHNSSSPPPALVNACKRRVCEMFAKCLRNVCEVCKLKLHVVLCVKVVAQGWTSSPKAMAGSARHPSAGRAWPPRPPEAPH